MTYGQTYITTIGQILASKTLESKILKFTKFAIGDGILQDDNLDTLKELKNLINPILSFDITNIKRDKEKQVDLQGVFQNTSLENATYLRELGLFAIDPDTQEEVLFAYVNYGDKAEYINNSELEKQERFYDMFIVIDNADNVTITIDSSNVYVTKRQLDEILVNKADKKKVYNIEIDTENWTEGTKTIEIEGILATDEVNIHPIWSETKETRQQEKEEYNKISMIKSGENTIEIICDEEVPEIALNARIEVVY